MKGFQTKEGDLGPATFTLMSGTNYRPLPHTAVRTVQKTQQIQ